MCAGLSEEAATCLNDGSSLVRAIARDAARRHGVDLLGHYRAAVTNTGQIEPGAIDGLAEAGSATDAALLRPLLAHPFGKIRWLLVRGRAPLERLTAREVEVLRLMAEGRSTSAIATTLVVSPSAVEKLVNSILTKLDVPPADTDHRRVLAVLRFLQG